MPQIFKNAVMTLKGQELLTKAQAEGIKIKFTKMAVGSGSYTEEEKGRDRLETAEALKDKKQSYDISALSAQNKRTVKLTALLSNYDSVGQREIVTEGFYINEIGVFAKADGQDGQEILYCIAVTETDKGDFMPKYNGSSPAQIIQDFYVTVANGEETTIDVQNGAFALQATAVELQQHLDKTDKEVATKIPSDKIGHADGVASLDAKGHVPPGQLPVAGATLGGVKSGEDITVGSDGAVTVNDNSHKHTIENVTDLQDKLDEKIPLTQKAAASGVATLDASSHVPDSQLNLGERTVTFTEAGSRENIAPTDTVKGIFGKIKKWFADLHKIAFSGAYKDLSGVPVDATESAGGLMSAADKKKLNGIADQANKYVLPVASSAAIGGVKSGGDITVDASGTVSVNNNSHDHTIANVSGLQTALDKKIETSKIGAQNGVAQLDAQGHVPQAQLPSYVDDVIEGYLNGGKFYKEAAHSTLIPSEAGKIYVDVPTNKTYRWSGNAYVVISETLALGTTNSTAFAGDKGNTAYTHATKKGSAFASNLYKIATNDEGHVTGAVAATKADITKLGIAESPHTHSEYIEKTAGFIYRGNLPNKQWDISTPGTYLFAPEYFTGLAEGQAAPDGLNYKYGHLIVFNGQGKGVTQLAVSRMTALDPSIAIRQRWDNSNSFCAWAYLKQKPDSAKTADSVAWTGVTGKPARAGASTDGGSATSAVKLDTATAGTATKPVYFSGGKPVPCTYELAKSVPANAVFTDTNTTYTANTGIQLSGTTFQLSCLNIPSNADLNSYTTLGLYQCPAIATVKTLKNCPTTNAFGLEVSKHAGTHQRLTEYMTNNPKTYERNSYSNAWGAWYQVYTSVNKPPDTNTTYTAGTGLSLSGTQFSAKLANNLTTTDASYALTANQGKVLKDSIDKLNTDIGSLISIVEYTNSSNIAIGLQITGKTVDLTELIPSECKAIGIAGYMLNDENANFTEVTIKNGKLVYALRSITTSTTIIPENKMAIHILCVKK